MTYFAAVATAKFEIYRAADGYRWRLKGGNGEIVAQGEAYVSRENVRRAVETVKRIVPGASIEDLW